MRVAEGHGRDIVLEHLCVFGEVLEMGDCAHDGIKRMGGRE